MSNPSGLGELLHYIADLVDQGSEKIYAQMDLNYRARYTPVLRAIDQGAYTITAITDIAKLTQSAISQSVALMEKDGLITKNTLSDARKSSLHLTTKGEALIQKLKVHWDIIFATIEQLEQEIGYPLLSILEKTAAALEWQSFDQRITQQLNQSQQSNNWFNSEGDQYAKYRPTYPEALGKLLASLTNNHQRALDVGCGTGQLTQMLAHYFDEVIGIDSSETQIKNTTPTNHIHYAIGHAEALPDTLNNINLITIAQAAHWVDLPKFYAESQRVAAPNAILALISYGVFDSDDVIRDRLHQFYYDDIGEYWPAERKLVDEGYKTIDFPFAELATEPMEICVQWNFNQLMGYISTWSAVKKAKSLDKENLLIQFHQELSNLWGDSTKTRTITWPINLRIGKLS